MFDPFGADIPIYTIKQTFAENDKLIFNDKTHKIFYNVKAFEKIANDVETKAFLEYLCKHQSTTKFTQSLETAVYRNRNNQNWRKDYMTLAYDLSLAAEKAFENGFSAGEERGISIGRNEGISLGAQQAKLETAKSMKSEDIPVNTIARFTGLSPEEIEKL